LSYRSYFFLRASHPAVASDARLIRVLAAERKVISRYSRITVEIATSCRTLSQSELETAFVIEHADLCSQAPTIREDVINSAPVEFGANNQRRVTGIKRWEEGI
jgi:hypothetical protein